MASELRLEWLPAGYVAERLGFSRQYLHKLIKRGVLSGQKVGCRWVVSSASLEMFEHARKVRKLHG